MSAQDEVEILWHGRWVVQDLIGQFGPYLSEHQKQTLVDLVVELDRIRRLRVERQGARLRQKQRRRVQAIRREVL